MTDVISADFCPPAVGRFVEARYRNLGWPAITLWEQKAGMKYLRAKGRAEIDEAMIFKTTLRQREIEDRAASRLLRSAVGVLVGPLSEATTTRRHVARHRLARRAGCRRGIGDVA